MYRLICAVLLAGFCVTVPGAEIRLLNEVRTFEVAELQVTGLPTVANPYDPEVADVTAVWTLPSGKEMRVPAFWYEEFEKSLVNGSERLTPAGSGQWRVRFTSRETGEHKLQLLFNQVAQGSTNIVFTNGAGDGFPTLSTNKQHFVTAQGKGLILNGANVCWHGARGTYDYADWFPAMNKAGENFARLWMSPWAFGIEASPETLNKYRQDRAWQLDQVVKMARTNGIYLMLCFDYHGMYETEPDFWGANNNWVNNPYSTNRGGPCGTPNAFFTDASAKKIYQKRMRYLVARYGAEPHLLAWQFFNEIDNVYRHLNATDVASWHREMGTWLKANDPFKHLVTTSLTSMSNRPEIWSLSQMDFSMFHSYGMPSPVTGLANVVQNMRTQYSKPVMVGEYGTDFRGWKRQENDPYLRGLRQGVWAGLMSGSVGSGMSWWWESIHAENVYPLYTAVSEFLRKSSFSPGSTKPITFQTSGAAPTTVGDLKTNGVPFNATLTPNAQWGWKGPGSLALVSPEAAGQGSATYNAFVHGSAHADLKNPFRISAWVGENAALVLHLNSVSGGAIMVIRVDGREVHRWAIPNKDNGWEVNNEYNQDVRIPLAAGKHNIEILNLGLDWFYLDWVRVEQVLPSEYLNQWSPSPVAIGQRGDHESWVYVVNPAIHYPSGAKTASPEPVKGGTVVLTAWPVGEFVALWYEAKSGKFLGQSEASTENAILRFQLPEFTEDIVGRITGPTRLEAFSGSSPGEFVIEVGPAASPSLTLEYSSDLKAWVTLPAEGTNRIVLSAESSAGFYRAVQQH